MARLRQQHPQDYGSSGKIHTDFENIIRYINAAELGNKTVGELLTQVKDRDSGQMRTINAAFSGNFGNDRRSSWGSGVAFV